MNIDLSALNAAELDQLIAEAAKRRAGMPEGLPRERPQTVYPVLNPAWWCAGVPEGSLLQIHHPGLGWSSYLIPHAERAHLLALLMHHSLLVNANQSPAIPAAPIPDTGTGGGGKLH